MRKTFLYTISLLLTALFALAGNGRLAGRMTHGSVCRVANATCETSLNDQTTSSLNDWIAPIDTLWGSTPDEQFRALYIEAIRQRHLGNSETVLELLQQCRQMRPEAPEVYYLLFNHYSELDEDSTALYYIRQAASIDTTNVKYMQSLAAALLTNKEYEASIPVMRKIVRLLPSDTDALTTLYALYKMMEQNDEALATLNRIEEVDGTTLDVTLAKMNLLAAQGRQEEEFGEMQKLIADHPYDPHLQVLAGNWLMGHSREQEAYDNYIRVLNDDPSNEEALLALIDYYIETEDIHTADSLRQQLIFSKKTSNETRLKLIGQHIADDISAKVDSTVTLAYLNRVLDADPNNVELRTQTAAYMQFIEVGDSLLQPQLEEILRQEPTNVWARIVLMQTEWANGQYDDVLTLAQEGTQYVPDEMAFYYFLGFAHYHQDQHPQALDALKRGVSQINSESNPEFVADFYAIMGDIYHERQMDDEAFQAYDSCLTWQPDNLPCLNNYAYYLSQRGGNLDQAEAMSRKTVDSEPDNPIYLDTYAWVLFCLERYDEADKYMQHALELVDEDKSIYYEHAGDINAMMGNTEKAVDYWTKALGSGDDKLLKKKIKRRQYLTK